MKVVCLKNSVKNNENEFEKCLSCRTNLYYPQCIFALLFTIKQNISHLFTQLFASHCPVPQTLSELVVRSIGESLFFFYDYFKKENMMDTKEKISSTSQEVCHKYPNCPDNLELQVHIIATYLCFLLVSLIKQIED